MRGAGVRFATAVQTSTFYQWDNRFIADASAANRDVIVGICTLNPDDRRSPSILNRYVTQSNVRGLRSIPAQSGRLDDPGVEALWSAAERLGITVNVLVNRDKRRELETLARRHPELPVVIDHCLNLKAGREQNEILSDMLALARIPNLHAKLSYVATGSREAVSIPGHARLVPCDHRRFRPDALRLGKRFSLQALVSQSHLYRPTAPLHPRTGAGGRGKATHPGRDGPAALFFTALRFLTSVRF